jgi:hypothetical protein
MHQAERRRDDGAGNDAEQDRNVGNETLPHLISDRITTSANSAIPMPVDWPKAGLGKAAGVPSTTRVNVCKPSPAQFMPTRIRETPITRMMVPVTTGGNSGSSQLMKGAATAPKIPAPVTEP